MLKKYMRRQSQFLIIILIGILIAASCAPTGGHVYRGRYHGQKQIELKRVAHTYLGVPYRYGGIDRSGMDCSGLVVRIFRDVYGTRLPHSTKELYKKGKPVSKRMLETGDLVFFREPGNVQPNHIGIFLEKGKFIHASGSKGVIISKLSTRYYRKRFIGAKRF